MAQLEIEKASGQLAEAKKLLQALEQLPQTKSEVIRLGSVVYTNQGNYFLSVPAGELLYDGVSYVALSPSSPLGAALMGKGAGSNIFFKQREFIIKEVV